MILNPDPYRRKKNRILSTIFQNESPNQLCKVRHAEENQLGCPKWTKNSLYF